MKNFNLILMTDSYKNSMMNGQYEEGTEYVYSYIESRGGKWDKTLFFGLQMFLKEYLLHPITQDDIDEAEPIWLDHMGMFDRAKWEYILKAHNGYLPVKIEAVPEGTVVDGKNILVSIVNTDPQCYWLTTYVETMLLRAVWFPTTVATNSYYCKQAIYAALVKSSDDPDGEIGFKLHDFSGRGHVSHESAGIGSAAHLVNFLGTDTIEAIPVIRRLYNEKAMPGYSISASEHSTTTSWGKAKEVDFYRHMLKHHAKPGGLVAMVSDSYDLWNAIDHLWGEELREEIIKSGALVICRPDSGDPETVPVEAVKRLGAKFGYTVNKKGYKVLKYVRVIQGDGINYYTILKILNNLLAEGWSAENIAFGMGGGLVAVNRDDLKFAMKCSAVCVNGEWKEVFKDPKTDPGKRSKKGRLALTHEDGVWKTVLLRELKVDDRLETVYYNGQLMRDQTFGEIRALSNIKEEINEKAYC